MRPPSLAVIPDGANLTDSPVARAWNATAIPTRLKGLVAATSFLHLGLVGVKLIRRRTSTMTID